MTNLAVAEMSTGELSGLLAAYVYYARRAAASPDGLQQVWDEIQWRLAKCEADTQRLDWMEKTYATYPGEVSNVLTESGLRKRIDESRAELDAAPTDSVAPTPDVLQSDCPPIAPALAQDIPYRRHSDAAWTERVKGLEARLERMTDLVRYQRHELFQEDLITECEYAELMQHEGAVPRLESYDQVKQQAERLRVALEQAQAELAAKDAVLEQYADHVAGCGDGDSPCLCDRHGYTIARAALEAPMTGGMYDCDGIKMYGDGREVRLPTMTDTRTDEEVLCEWMEPRPSGEEYMHPGKTSPSRWWEVHYPASSPSPSTGESDFGDPYWRPRGLDLDALRDVEARLTQEQWKPYVEELLIWKDLDKVYVEQLFALLHVSAAQKIAALAKIVRPDATRSVSGAEREVGS